MSAGTDFAEIYCENKIANSIHLIDGKIDNSLTSRDKGVGIRIFKGLHSIYATARTLVMKEYCPLLTKWP